MQINKTKEITVRENLSNLLMEQFQLITYKRQKALNETDVLLMAI